MPLADYQQTLSSRLVGIFERSGCVVISGRTGFGKHSVAAAASQLLGLEFIPVVVDAPARAVCKALLGHDDLTNANCAENGLLFQENACIFLAGAEHIDPELLPILREVFRTRSLRGLALEPHSPVVAISLCTDDPAPVLRETDHFVLSMPCIRFPGRLGARDLYQVTGHMLADMRIDGHLEEEHFKNVRLPREGLGALRKWLIEAAITPGSVDHEDLLAAMAADVFPFVEQISYRGNQVTRDDYLEWVSQFDSPRRPIVDHLIRVMVERKYVMSLGDFNRTVDDIVFRSGIPRGNQVVLCEWQPFGKSGPVMTHKVKERGNWGGRAISINLDHDPEVWVKAISGRTLPVILADDFVGTGDSIVGVEPRIRMLLDMCPSVSVWILLVAGFTDGIQRVRHLEQQYEKRVKIIVGRLLSNYDTCFQYGSDLLGPDERQALGDFCDEFGRLVKTRIPRGYGELGALFAFPDSMPNTTLPIFWYDGKPNLWRPLLPASMIVD